MRYERPNVEILASATAMVQSITKLIHNAADNIVQGSEIWTDGMAYQADE